MALHRHALLAATALAAVALVVDGQGMPRGEDIFPVSCYLNVMLIWDRSDSVLGGFNRSRDFVLSVSEELNISPHAHSVSMIVYSGTHYRREIYPWNFVKNNDEFKAAVRGIRAIGGTTNTKLALDAAYELMDTRNKSIPSLVMVVTDGRSAVDPAAEAKRLQNIPSTWMFAAATGDPVLADKKELLAIAGHINHVVLQSGRELAEVITRKLLREAQDKCRTTTTSTTTTTTSTSTTTTSTTTTTTTTTTTNPFTGCEQDLVLVLDFSTTTQPVYKDYMELSERLVNQLYVSPRHTRVALISFASVVKTHTQFSLNTFKSAEQVVSKIRSLQYIGGTTAIGQGFIEGVKQADEAKGARPGVANKIMIVFTDGWNNKGPEPAEEAKKAEAAGFHVFSVSVVPKNPKPDDTPINMPVLEAIVKDKQSTFTTNTYDELIRIVRERNVRCINEHIEK